MTTRPAGPTSPESLVTIGPQDLRSAHRPCLAWCMTRTPRHLAACLLAIPWPWSPPAVPTSRRPRPSSPPPRPLQVKGTVVSTAVSSNEAQIVVPEPVTATWTALGQKGSGLEWVSVAGDGTTKSTDIDLATDPTTGVASVPESINADAAQSRRPLDVGGSRCRRVTGQVTGLGVLAPPGHRGAGRLPRARVRRVPSLGRQGRQEGRRPSRPRGSRGDLRGHAGRRRAGQAVQAAGRLPAGGLGGPGQSCRRQEGDLLRRHRHRRRDRHDLGRSRSRSQRRLRLRRPGQDPHLHAAVPGSVRRRPAGLDRQEGHA